MDLRDIEKWTQLALEAEASRRGIRDPHLRTRAALVRLILRDQYGDRINRGRKRVAEGLENLSQAREILGAAALAAAEVLPKPLGTMVQLSLRWTSAGSLEAPKVPAEQAYPTAQAPEQAPTARTAGPRPEPPTGVSRASGVKLAGTPLGPSVGPTVRRFEQEPIRTHSMARLLARQGHKERALAIYEELLARNTDDQVLRQEADILRRAGDVMSIPSELPEPLSDLEPPHSDDRIACDRAQSADQDEEQEAGIDVRWEVTEAGTARAAAVLGGPGELAVRLVAIHPDPERIVRSEITEFGPVAEVGAWRLPPVPVASRCFVAIGLRNQDRFVSIAHTRP